MSKPRPRGPYPCIECGGRGWIKVRFKDGVEDQVCERCEGTGVE